MRFLLLLFCSIVLTGCVSLDDLRRSTTRPEYITLSAPVRVEYEVKHVRTASVYEMPAGKYTPFHENQRHVFYLGENIEITKRWLKFKLKIDEPRVRRGGIVFDKKTGSWWVFTLGPAADVREDGMPELGMFGLEKIGSDVVNHCAQFAAVDKEGNIVDADTSFGNPDTLAPVEFHGAVPLPPVK